MTRRFVSAADVARRAGVSRSAVSRAFTPGAQVSEAARKRIQEAAEDLGYRVNRLARTLHQQRSDLVGVVGGNLVNPYISAQLEALSAGLQRRGLQCLLLNSGGGGDLAALLDYRVRSVVLLSGAAPDELVRLCARNGARMVLIGRPAPPEGTSADLILADSAAGGRLAARRLIAAGCRNVAVVQSASRTSAKVDRADAFCTEMQAAGVTFTRWAEGPNSYDTGCSAARVLLAQPGIDGIFGVTDELALGVLNTARSEMGRDVPRSLSVIGFDDAPVSAWASHGLTTIRQSLSQLTEATLDAVERGPSSVPRTVRLPVTLVERCSVSPRGAAAPLRPEAG
ncbi:LacI family transcriptional regulator [Salipiger pallidus]|uniref:LacI family transcriptional regulator n=1 Tax=Salipiger pallidus TaxID=1775170 RepID=A0A8J3EGB2_9RHOB|nr:LacI family DNA-binding transcriptional regulator [Salipiger pallidus]GGG66466.1 LacI family transcriptional regulator [Salipiger pallidus]